MSARPVSTCPRCGSTDIQMLLVAEAGEVSPVEDVAVYECHNEDCGAEFDSDSALDWSASPPTDVRP